MKLLNATVFTIYGFFEVLHTFYMQCFVSKNKEILDNVFVFCFNSCTVKINEQTKTSFKKLERRNIST